MVGARITRRAVRVGDTHGRRGTTFACGTGVARRLERRSLGQAELAERARDTPIHGILDGAACGGGGVLERRVGNMECCLLGVSSICVGEAGATRVI